MGVLDEIIRRLEETSAPLENRKWSTIDDCVELLIELSKPVQYVVEIRQSCETIYNEIIGKEIVQKVFKSKLGDISLSADSDLEYCKKDSLDELNYLRKALKLPPLTIRQITFVEV